MPRIVPTEPSPLPTPDDAVIAETMLALIAARAPQSSICPSEVARALAKDAAAWRALMPRVRAVAATLAARRRIAVTQRGEDRSQDAPWRGAIRLRRPFDESPGDG